MRRPATRSCDCLLIAALGVRRAGGAPAGAEWGEGAPASDGDGGSGGAKPPGLWIDRGDAALRANHPEDFEHAMGIV